MAFQRTRLAADRTLMAVIRTSLSQISFGFTIYQFFQKLKTSNVVTGSAESRNFGVALVWLGIGTLTLGILYHVRFMWGLRQERTAMKLAGIVHAESAFPPSMTLVIAVLLLALGVSAIISIVFHIGPFG